MGSVAKCFNPFSSILVLRDPGTLTASICFGIYYMVHTCLQASLSTVFVDIYKVSGLVAGLVYVPFGVGCSIAAFVAGKKSILSKIRRFAGAHLQTGRIVDRDYKITAEKFGVVIDRSAGDDLSSFPIERARLRSCKYSVFVCSLLVVAYGWTLQIKIVRYQSVQPH